MGRGRGNQQVIERRTSVRQSAGDQAIHASLCGWSTLNYLWVYGLHTVEWYLLKQRHIWNKKGHLIKNNNWCICYMGMHNLVIVHICVYVCLVSDYSCSACLRCRKTGLIPPTLPPLPQMVCIDHVKAVPPNASLVLLLFVISYCMYCICMV